MGLLALVRWMEEFAREWDLDSGAIAAACDNRVAVAAASNYMLPAVLKSAHFDIVSALRALVRRSPIRWSFRHVKGHTAQGHRSSWERLNVEADATCKRYWHRRVATGGLLDQGVAENEWAVWLGDGKVCSAFQLSATQWLQCQSASRYWDGRMGSEASALVDWDVTGRAMRGLPRPRQVWIAKQSSGMCATGSRMFAQGRRE
jgi:hypothetical protein